MRWGVLGTASAALCGLHCLAMPVIAGASCCAREGMHGAPAIEAGMIGVAAVVGYATLKVSYLQHRRLEPLAMLTVGLLVMLGSYFFLEGAGETAASVAGALILIAAQLLNRKCPAPCCNSSGGS